MVTPIKNMRLPEQVVKNLEKYQAYNNFSSFTQAAITALTLFFKEHPVPDREEK